MHATTDARLKNKLAAFCVALAATVSAHAGPGENPILTQGIAGVKPGMSLQTLRHLAVIKKIECDGLPMQGAKGVLSDSDCMFDFKPSARLGGRVLEPEMSMAYMRKNKVVAILAYIPLSAADKKLGVQSLLSDIAGSWADKVAISDRETIFKNKATFSVGGQPQWTGATVAFRVKRMADGDSVVVTLGDPEVVAAVSGHFPNL